MDNEQVNDNQTKEEKEIREDQERLAAQDSASGGTRKEESSASAQEGEQERNLRLLKNKIASAQYFNSVIFGFLLVILSGIALQTFFVVTSVKDFVDINQVKLNNTISSFESMSVSSKKSLEDIGEVTTRGKAASIILLTDERAKELANYLDVLNYNTQVSQNDLKQAINESVKTSQEIRAGIKPILASANTMVEEGTGLIVEAKHQLKQNGDSANELLQQGKTLIAHSEKDLLETLKNINQTMAGISVITNDPNLQKLIENSNLTASNIQVTTKEIADLSTFYLHPLSHPVKPKGFNKYFFQPVLKIAKIINGTSGVLYLVNRIQ